ncbi:MAG: aminotransferase class V-fold PLP-dependent enzyme [Flavobacteriales bacterium]|nr:aminotransferase class V-fold PLP-dependent enzyme [Flavobacteriales bacterium]MBT3964049.1 aminotransferase class V-fold PLP-dependent enzyme [Flavobacteriales bacterium]MBT4704734.1 aminotransferase class V-fold PLP-dependent enzyme [Flavobacteriales bacterium]MBT4931683.1 aminotransferase class V-fold PLP-dependent enzyme [Flavobacteriales bacterium]MBT5133649.1 aminotransferase class V-fold PLP-dependent enzyme [Flavobacteriales bacterium]
MTNRRSFIQKVGTLSAGVWAWPFIDTSFAAETKNILSKYPDLSPKELSDNEDFWSWVRHNYIASSSMVNLNNGGVSPHPKVVLEAVERFTRLSNEAPSYYMWRVFEKGRETIREKLADLAGVSSEEIAINRNTTEALATLISGLDMTRGDEFVTSNFIYPNMNQAWKQRELREGIVRKIAKLPMPSTNTEEIVKAYTDQFTDKTKIALIEHVVNWTGQVLPVAAIAAEAKKRGILVMVDGAHSFAHLVFKISDLNCDYFGTSLHKWLCAPFGTGMLWIKKDLIARHWAMFPGPDPQSADVRKFENQGTRDVPAELAIGQAIDFHLSIGSERKFERLHYLKQYWVERVKGVKGIQFWCPEDPNFSGALTTFSIEGKEAKEIHDILWKEERIHTTTISHEGISGVRVTPNVYTSTKDLDRLIRTIKGMA